MRAACRSPGIGNGTLAGSTSGAGFGSGGSSAGSIGSGVSGAAPNEGVTVAGVDGGESPAGLVAVTVTVYVVSLTSPSNRAVVSVAAVVWVNTPPAPSSNVTV
jgi:hypothetical protein